MVIIDIIMITDLDDFYPIPKPNELDDHTLINRLENVGGANCCKSTPNNT
jgi:hypothetical protein